MLKNLLVIASSAKRGGACIACVDIESYQFIRPIPYKSKEKYWNFDPLEMQILSLWEVPLFHNENNTYQPENCYADSREKWKCIKKQINYSKFLKISSRFTKVTSLLTPNGYLFVSEVEKSIKKSEFGSINLVKAENAELFLRQEDYTPRLWISFYKNGVKYKYKATYKVSTLSWNKLKEKFYNNANFKVELPKEVFLTLTGALFGDFYNIFVSGIIMQEPLDAYLERFLK